MRTFIHKDVVSKNICKDIIKYYEKNKKNSVPGVIGKGVDLNCKDSKDIYIRPDCKDFPFDQYFKELQICLENYMSIYRELCQDLSHFGMYENVNIQKYKGGGGFKKSHCERANPNSVTRLLVFMTYLNNAKKGGTYFKYQDYTTECIEGDTYIWPAEWTHMHSGIITNDTKYIITGWYNITIPNN